MIMIEKEIDGEYITGVHGLGGLKENLICSKLSVDKLTKVWYNVGVRR